MVRFRVRIAMLIWFLSVAVGAQPARGDLLVNMPGDTTPYVLTTLNGADDAVTHRSLPFPLHLYDRSYTAVDVSTNGNVNFSGNPSYSNVALPNPAMPAIMPLWDDLVVDTGTSGASPTPKVMEFSNDTCYAVTWQNVALVSGASPPRHTFQLAWFRDVASLKGFTFAPDDIAFSYGALGASFSGSSATVGLQGDSFEQSTSLPGVVANNGWIYDTSLLPAATNQFVLFRPIDSELGTVYKSAALQVDPGTGAINVLRGTLAFDGTQSIHRSITGNGGIAKAGPGIVTLGTTNTYTGDTSVYGGTLRAATSGSLPNTTNLFLSDGAALDPQGLSVTVAMLDLRGGQLAAGAGVLNVTGTTLVDRPTMLDLKGGALSTATLAGVGQLQFVNGTLDIRNAWTLDASSPLGASVTLGPGQTLRGENTTTLAGGSTLVVESGGAYWASTTDNNGEIVLDGPTAELGGSVLNNNGLVRGEGRLTTILFNNAGGEFRAEAGQRLRLMAPNNPNNGKLNLQGGTLEFNQPLTNNAGQILGRGTLIVGGPGLTNNGSVAFSSGVTDVFAKLTNNTGSATKGITISGNADVTFWDDVTNTTPSLFKVSAGSSATFFGTVAGSISGSGSKYFEADLTPGAGAAATVDLGGDTYLESTARLLIGLGGSTVGSFDQVHVENELSLAGALVVAPISGFTPAAGQSFDLLDWHNLSGTFSSLTLPALAPGLMWNASQLYATGTLSVFLAGDYNGNGVVDAADYVVYRNSLGQAGVGLAADGDGNRIIGPGDLDVWRTHFGQHASGGSGIATSYPYGAGSAIPEPVPNVLLLSATLALAATRSRWRTGSYGSSCVTDVHEGVLRPRRESVVQPTFAPARCASNVGGNQAGGVCHVPNKMDAGF